ncbi:Glucose-6-phosphate isomerase B [Achromobacter insolitus]|uniref:hypothetical protein n=1 Tax=Achromobacter insolitus TaxID=217204 RepID=UPI000972C827|nr:hypothetical protein [Achromobacter insolitus]APX75652.1 hypothetical protein BUW96_12740 [Achromobacter insolitus]OWT59823.1 hypothetical protein CEY08_17335 [Achromobacter insolitus]CAB3705067.1 Glucose-6-phosphate isomerase [Achromobacter insolitus]VEG67113.1 Glucose-6-phosphate isomerase B [Achromobacter insolitus]
MHTPLTYGAGFPGRPAKLVEKRLARRTPVRLGRHAAPLNGFTFHAPASLAARVQRRIDQAESEAWMARLWRRDATLWTGNDEGRWLGWLHPGAAPRELGRMAAICRKLCVAGFSDAVLLGMGGASLGAEALAHTLGMGGGGLRLHVLDSTDAAQVRAVQSAVDLTRCLFVVSSKSGSTLESRMLAAYFHEQVARRLGRQEAGTRFVAITDPGSAMLAQARDEGYAAVFEGEPSIGGRNSVLSPFGLVALTLLGHDPAAFLRDTRPMLRACGAEAPARANPGLILGALLGEAALDGRDKLTLLAAPGLEHLGCWLEQLLAESTGKNGTGIVPVDHEPPGDPEDYGRDRMFVHLAKSDAPCVEMDLRMRRLAEAGFPVLRCELPSARLLGQEFFRWEVATAVAAAVLHVNPFDQPDVEASKVRTRALALRHEAGTGLAEGVPLLVEGALAFHGTEGGATAIDLLASHISGLDETGYVSLLAYIARNEANEAWLAAMRCRLRQATGAATMGGFGPRYLHSIGQLHKGGPPGGRFLFITADVAVDLEAPGHALGFAATQRAQALGDMEELVSRGRPCLRVHIAGPIEAGLAQLAGLLDQAMQGAAVR